MAWPSRMTAVGERLRLVQDLAELVLGAPGATDHAGDEQRQQPDDAVVDKQMATG
jgi:hypothetical protein